jgi:hypothetical protein
MITKVVNMSTAVADSSITAEATTSNTTTSNFTSFSIDY